MYELDLIDEIEVNIRLGTRESVAWAINRLDTLKDLLIKTEGERDGAGRPEGERDREAVPRDGGWVQTGYGLGDADLSFACEARAPAREAGR